jgi:hypothetical protein
VLSSCLRIFATGAIQTWSAAAFDDKKALLGGSVRELVKNLGVHAVLIWTAMILKKRIVVGLPIFKSHLFNFLTLIFRLWATLSRPSLQQFGCFHSLFGFARTGPFFVH